MTGYKHNIGKTRQAYTEYLYTHTLYIHINKLPTMYEHIHTQNYNFSFHVIITAYSLEKMEEKLQYCLIDFQSNLNEKYYLLTAPHHSVWANA